MVTKKTWQMPLIATALVLMAILSVPISNFFMAREIVPVTSGIPEFKPVSVIIQNKCADCHSPELGVRPLYENLPFAKQLIEKDRQEAQSNIKFGREKLSGAEPFSRLDLARIENVVENNEMPPLQYKAMHWNAGLTKEERGAILLWIKAQISAGRTGATSQ